MAKRAANSPKRKLGLLPCPGLVAGVFTDCRGRRHDLAKQSHVSAKEVAGTYGLPTSVRKVLALIRDGELYPAFRENQRVVRIYPCGVADYWDRLTLPRLVRTDARRFA